ncbi:sensor domain-containing protein [Luteimonas sp. MJ246]|uniref:sensor domain-containing protein n=1 Tax=Luteimonas sp. MJ174 TaxID=3129237 RepID=UPI0031BA4466
MNSLPHTIPEYLDQLRRALAGADPAMIQDALYDAEEYLRSELAENPGRSEAEVIAAVASSYGAPSEVADIYRDTEATVQTALRAPVPPRRKSMAGRFFGVVADPRTYASLFYMVLALATGIFYFTWVVAGFSTTLGLSITIVGIPLLILFFGSVRVLSLVEGRIVEVMLGERMPRRPLYTVRGRSIWQRIGDMFTDLRTWSTMLYMLLMLPLGIIYFTLATTLLAIGISFVLAPIASWTGIGDAWLESNNVVLFGFDGVPVEGWGLLPMLVGGVLLLFATLHLARAIGRGHGLLAKHLLVKTAQYS